MIRCIFSFAVLICLIPFPMLGKGKAVDFSDRNLPSTELSGGIEFEIKADIRNPAMIKLHPDGFLLVSENGSGNALYAIDLKDKSVEVLCKAGRAENEVLSVWDLSVDGSDVVISSLENKKVLRFGYDAKSRSFALAGCENFEKYFGRIVPFGNDGYCVFAKKVRLELWNKYGETVNSGGSFPEIFDDEAARNNVLFQSDIAISDDGSRIFVACKTFDEVEMYDSSLNLVRRFNGPQPFKPQLKVMETAFGKMVRQNPMKFTFRNVTFGGTRFYAGYVGVEPKVDSDFDRQIGKIYEFDINGKPRRVYNLHEEAVAFDVNDSLKEIYCIVNTMNGVKIVRYAL